MPIQYDQASDRSNKRRVKDLRDRFPKQTIVKEDYIIQKMNYYTKRESKSN
jgi:hypothetical protein